MSRDSVNIHFWACSDPQIPSATGCRVGVRNIESLYAHCTLQAVVHPNGLLHTTPWGNQEFAILDPDSNLVTFFEPIGQVP